MPDMTRQTNTHTLGFLLGPRLNAGGRLGRSDLGLQLLCSADDDLANAIAQQLDELNMQRRITEKEVQQQAEEMALAKLTENPDLTNYSFIDFSDQLYWILPTDRPTNQPPVNQALSSQLPIIAPWVLSIDSSL